MKKSLFTLLMLIATIYSNAQDFLNLCINFEDSITENIKIDSGSIWQIGKPGKAILDSSYQSQNCIITSLDSLYNNIDTSVFRLTFGSLPDYLGLYPPIHLDMRHRFKTNSNQDYGKVEMSIDYGQNWYHVFESNSIKEIKNYHVYESGDTINDSLHIVGNSNGWVHSFADIDLRSLNNNPTIDIDSVIFRYTFISDSTGLDDGWQIDDICINMDLSEVLSIKDLSYQEKLFELFPNPVSEVVKIDFSNMSKASVALVQIDIFDSLGKKVYQKNEKMQGRFPILQLDVSKYSKGIYYIKASMNGKEYGNGKFVKD